MIRPIWVFLLAGCVASQGWAQAPSGQVVPEQVAAEPRSDRNQTADPTAVPAGGERAAAQPMEGGFPLDQFKEFSALVTGGILPGDAGAAHIYRYGNLFRSEGLDEHSFFVMDLTKSETHMVASKMCAKSGLLNSRSFPFFLTGPEYKYLHAPVGEETVDGHACRVEDITITSTKFRKPVHLRLWEAQDLQGFPIKIENRPVDNPHRTLQFSEVVLGDPDPTLFIFPATCQSMAGFKTLHPASPPKKTPAPAQ